MIKHSLLTARRKVKKKKKVMSSFLQVLTLWFDWLSLQLYEKVKNIAEAKAVRTLINRI